MYGILIYDGVEPIDLGATFGVFSMAKRITPDLAYFGVAKRKGPVEAANGLTVLADHGFDDCPALSSLIVTGGPGWVEAAKDDATLDFIRKTGAKRAAICTGAMILKAAGVLDGRTATTKSAVFPGETPPLDLLGADGVKTVAAAVVDDGAVVTGGGVTLGIDTVFHLLSQSHGDEVAAETARVMEYGRALEANRAALGYVAPETVATR